MKKIFFIFSIVFIILGICAGEIKKAEIPSPEKQKNIQKVIDEIIEQEIEDYQNKKISSQDLASKYIEISNRIETLDELYVLNQEALSLYAQAGRLDNVMEIIEKQDQKFIIPKDELIFDHLMISLKAMKGEQAESNLSHLIKIYQNFIDQAKFSYCNKIDRLLISKNRLFSNFPEYETFKLLQKEANLLQKQFIKKNELKNRLDKAPDDPILNQNYAELILITEHNWEQALPYFCKSNNLQMAQTANEEKNLSPSPKKYLEWGHFYWNLASQCKIPLLSLEYRKHAANYYQKGFEQCDNIEKVLVTRRIEESQQNKINVNNQGQIKLHRSGQSIQLEKKIKLDMVFIPKGTFIIGAAENELPRNSNEKQYTVTLSHDFYMGKYEVTQEQYESIMKVNPSHFKGEKKPIDSVSWHDAQAFCKELNQRFKNKCPNGYVFRLPTDAEWEYACRAGEDKAHVKNVEKMAWFSQNSDNQTHEVGKKQGNKWGLYDMYGNIWELTYDLGNGGYPNPEHPKLADKIINPFSKEGSIVLCRGQGYSANIQELRATFRGSMSPDGKGNFVGFRIVLAKELETIKETK